MSDIVKRKNVIQALERFKKAPRLSEIDYCGVTMYGEFSVISLEDLETLKPLLDARIEFNTRIGGIELNNARCAVHGEWGTGNNMLGDCVAWVNVNNKPLFDFLADCYMNTLEAIEKEEGGEE